MRPDEESRRDRGPEVPAEGMTVNADGCGVDDLSFCGAVQVTVAAGMPWADLVAAALERDWVGLESLAGLTGTVGAVVARNETVHGRSVADAVASVRTWDRRAGAQRTFAAADCGFREGGSRFGDESSLTILDVSFLLPHGDLSAPITDAGLARRLGIDIGARVPLARVHEAVTRG